MSSKIESIITGEILVLKISTFSENGLQSIDETITK